jgi:hypothetical protein
LRGDPVEDRGGIAGDFVFAGVDLVVEERKRLRGREPLAVLIK